MKSCLKCDKQRVEHKEGVGAIYRCVPLQLMLSACRHEKWGRKAMEVTATKCSHFSQKQEDQNNEMSIVRQGFVEQRSYS